MESIQCTLNPVVSELSKHIDMIYQLIVNNGQTVEEKSEWIQKVTECLKRKEVLASLVPDFRTSLKPIDEIGNDTQMAATLPTIQQ